MNIELHHIIHSLSLIIAQRLVRTLCLHCKEKQDHYYIPKECSFCLHGYHGRTAVYECLTLDETIHHLLSTDSPHEKIKHHLEKNHFTSLYQAAHFKAKQGITSLSEIKRVIG